MEEKSENLDVDQIEVAEFEFLGLKVRFELSSKSDSRNQILRIKNKKLGSKSKIGHGYACSNPQSGRLLDF